MTNVRLSNNSPTHLVASGGDFFILALFHPHNTNKNPDSTCRLSLVLDASFSLDLLAEILEKSLFFTWLSRAEQNRPLPLMLPRWKAKSSVSSPISRQGDAIHTLSGLGFRLEEGHGAKLILHFSWPHEMMDARGAEVLIKNLRHVHRTGADLPDLIFLEPTNLRQKLRSLWRFPQHLKQAQRAVHYITQNSRALIAALGQVGVCPEKDTTRHYTIDFSEQETLMVDEHSRKQGAGFARSLFYLAVTIQAVDKVLRRRKTTSNSDDPTAYQGDGLAVGDYVIPVPMDLRRRGKPGPAMSNHVSTLTYRVAGESAADLGGIIKDLKSQMVEQMEKGVPEDCRLMMDLFRRMPVALYSGAMLGPTKGQIGSFFFSDIGESLPATEDFLGARIFEATHFAPTRNPPGLTFAFMRHRKCLKVALSYRESCLAPDELICLAKAMQTGLRGGDQPE